MSETVRFGVSLDSDLLDDFDGLIRRLGYASRSEAVRDLIRARLLKEGLEAPDVEAFGTVMLVYDHHVTGLTGRLTRMQHDAPVEVVATMHVHMDHHNCLEVLVMRGAGAQVRALGQKLLSLKGVHYGSVELGAIGHQEEHHHETD